MPAPEAIKQLVERFHNHIDDYKSGKYNETEVRRDFIDPMFEALDWDIANKEGRAEQYREVIHEDAIKIGGTTKAPDYCFTLSGKRMFFVEAKKPSVNLEKDIAAAYQVRRYAWTAKHPLAILTDFEEFAVYDCRVKPKPTDKAYTARVLYIKYDEYLDRWDEIEGIFTKEAIHQGSFDRFAAKNGLKRGTAEVDDEFLSEIESWRDLLATNIALRNKDLNQRQLNYVVQRVIDRIIFLRICEDRGIEESGQLKEIRTGKDNYQRMIPILERADKKYNSGLFHFKKEKGQATAPDELSLGIKIDDKVIKKILSNLYYPESPYEFSVLPAEILGQVYEKFLGKVIRLTKGHRAKVEDKPEVKKAGGVYYTPTYIVDYIVKNTIGKLVEGKTPRQVAKLTICDPACGSGSFLLGAYQYLLDWHRDYYTQKSSAQYKNLLFQGSGGEWRLTTQEKKRILLNNIYGVDIDSQAVEVTKLSLLLKVLEGENEDTLSRQLSLLQERALPDLGNNIKCGNSLIGTDFYNQFNLGLLDEELEYKINVFDWDIEFESVFRSKTPGFAAVIGNPPWGALFTKEELDYHRQKYSEIIVRMIDSFMYFVHKGIDLILPSGVFGMILPDVLLYQKDNQKLRKYLLDNCQLRYALNMGNVFEKVTRPTSILVMEKSPSPQNVVKIGDYSHYNGAEKAHALAGTDEDGYETLLQKDLHAIPGNLYVTSQPEHYQILNRILNNTQTTLQDLIDGDGIQRGVSPDLKEAFIVEDAAASRMRLESSHLRPVLTGGKHVKRYHIVDSGLSVIYTSRHDNFTNLPQICKYIDQYKDKITCKEVKQGKHPRYSLHRPRNENIFLKEEKVLGVITGDRISVALDTQKWFASDGLYLFSLIDRENTQYVMAILNSKLFVFLYRLLTAEKGRVLAQVKPTVIGQMPIMGLDKEHLGNNTERQELIDLVKHLVGLTGISLNATTDEEKRRMGRRVFAAEQQIDKLIYELYGLTDEEIRIVEGSV